MLDYKLSNLSCGSVYSFNLVAHNIAGRSKPSATITTPTLGSIPQNVNTDRIITANITFITLHLHRWPDGGCPIHYYVIEYKEEWQPTWRIVSNNIRSEEENIIISDLLPSTWYSLQLTAHNGAGSKVVTTQFATLSNTGQTLMPRTATAPPDVPGIQQTVDGSIAIPIISAILITSTILLIAVYIFRKRRYLGLGRYAGYTQGSSEYSVKSLTEREAAKIIDPARVHLYSPHSLHNKRNDKKGNITADTNNPYETLPYATYRRPDPKTHPLNAYPSNTLEYSQQFQTFGRHENYQGCPHPDLVTKTCYKTAVWDSKSLGKESTNMDQLKSSLEISCISNQHTLPMSTMHMLNSSKERMVETRFSLPANVFLEPSFTTAKVSRTSPDDIMCVKYATLGRIKKNNNHNKASDLLQDSDSSTESSIQNSKQAARLSRRLKKYKNQKRYGAAHIYSRQNIVYTYHHHFVLCIPSELTHFYYFHYRYTLMPTLKVSRPDCLTLIFSGNVGHKAL